MCVRYKKGCFQYVCQAARQRYAKPVCQCLSGQPIDTAIVEEFFRVLQLAEIDALEQVSSRQADHQRALACHLEQEVARLEYAAVRAERQYQHVDPENRLIAATLEKRWESALAELEQARSRLTEAKSRLPQPVAVPPELRETFADVGRRLPDLWPRLKAEARKKLLRTLVVGVNLNRDDDGIVQIRIVWRGGLVGEKHIRVALNSFRYSKREREVIERIRQLADAGCNDVAIARHLNEGNLFACRGGAFTPTIVRKLRGRNAILLGSEKVRRGEVVSYYTIPEVAKLIAIDPSWIYRGIGEGKIVLEKHPCYNCYLFPRDAETIARMKQLKTGKVRQVAFPKGAL